MLQIIRPLSFLLLLLLSFYTQARTTNTNALKNSCINILAGSRAVRVPPKAIKRLYMIDFNGSKGLEVLSVINKIFLENRVVKVTEGMTQISVPVSEWSSLFKTRVEGLPLSFENVAEELRKVVVQRIDVYADKTEAIEVESSLLLSYQIDENYGSKNYVINLDPKFGKLLELQMRELVSVYWQLESGLLWSESIYDPLI